MSNPLTVREYHSKLPAFSVQSEIAKRADREAWAEWGLKRTSARLPKAAPRAKLRLTEVVRAAMGADLVAKFVTPLLP